jgi:hypothetical protein
MVKCSLFLDDPRLATAPYSVGTPVSAVGPFLFCDEFRFVTLSERFSVFRQSADFHEVVTMEDCEARLRLSALEERLLQRDRDFALLRSEFGRESQTQE